MRLNLIVSAAWACLSPAFAQDIAGIGTDLYAGEAQCATVLREFHGRQDRSPLALSVASEVCYVSRLVDGLAQTQGAGNGASLGADRSLGPPDAGPAGRDQGQGAAFQRAVASRDAVLQELVQTDPHEANDLLKRLLGPSEERKG